MNRRTVNYGEACGSSESEAHWYRIRFESRGRSGQRIATGLMAGDRIRRNPSGEEEIFKGCTGAGYSTDRHTYRSLEGWQVWRRRPQR